MSIYLENGYLDYKGIKEIGQKYIYIIGGRGIGKSHLTVDIKNSSAAPLLYVRRSNVDLSNSFCCMSDFSKNEWFGANVIYKYNDKKGLGYAYKSEEDLQANKPFIYGISLSTFNNKTGIDFTQFYDIVFDEFIPQKKSRPIRNEFQAYKNIMEAVYRNRNIDDSEKITTWFFGNSNAIMSNILIGYRLIPDIYKAVKSKIEITQVDRCEATLILPFKSKVSLSKNSNPFYRNLPKNQKRMEIYNEFADMEDDRVQHQNLKEFIQDFKTPAFSVWIHKRDFRFYVTKRVNAIANEEFFNTQSSLEKWQKECKKFLRPMFLSGDITFSTYEVQCDFLASFDCVSWNEIAVDNT